MSIIQRLIIKLRDYYLKRGGSKNYVKFLRLKGISIGNNCYFQDPKTTLIDCSRPSLVEIGDNCFFNSYFELMTHDWVSHVFLWSGKTFVNSSGRVKIGNNVAFARHCMVLKGVEIGDNCFIGAYSLVTQNIPPNSIAVGCPAKVIMSLDDYYEKRMNRAEDECFEYARSIEERYQRRPDPSDFKEEFIYFVSGSQIEDYPELPIRNQLGPIYEKYRKEHIAKYKSFDDFLKATGCRL